MMNRHGVSPAAVGRIGIALLVLVLAGCGALLTPQYRIARAQREMHAGEWQRAAFDLRVVVHKNPRNAQAWLLLSQLSLTVGDLSGAHSGLQHAIAVGAKGAAVDALQARIWLESGHAEQLLKALQAHALQLPQPDRTLLEARALVMVGHADQAIARVQPLLIGAPNLTEARDLLAEAHAQLGQFPAAFAQLKAAVARDPKSPEPRLIEGRIEAALGHFSAAERALLGALKRMPPAEPMLHRVTALSSLIETRLALAQIEPASRTLAVLLKLEPDAPRTQLLQARVKLARGAVESGIDELERVVANAPGFVPARTLLGAALLQHGDLQQAQQQLQQVLGQVPNDLRARMLLAQVQLKLGESGAAMQVLAPMLRGPNLDSQALALFGTAARRSHDTRALIEALERTAARNPHDRKVELNLAAVYLSVGENDRALALLEKDTDSADLRRDRLLITALLKTRGVDAASAAVKSLLTEHLSDPGILTLAAGYYASGNQLPQARVLLQRVLSIHPDDFAAQVALAHIEEAEGHSALAQRHLRATLAAHPDVLEVRVALADALARARQFAAARKILQAATHARSDPEVQFALARVALAEGKLPVANTALDRALAARPGSTTLMEAAGLLLLRANQPEAALARLAQAAALESGNALYWLNTARAQLAVNQPMAARASLEKADRLQPHWFPVVQLLSFIDLHQGKSQAALARVEALLKNDPQDPLALALEGDIETRMGQPSAAIVAYRAAQRRRPSAAVAVKLYQANLAAGAPDPAAPLKQWLKRWPGDWRVRTVLGDYDLQVAHQPKQAIAEFNQALRVNRNNVAALNNLAWVLGQHKDPRAQSFAERAYRLAPHSPQVNDTLGWILARAHQAKQALAYLQRAAALKPDDPEIQYHYAYALAETGERAQAREILTRILGGKRAFESRRDALRLLATLKA